MAHHHNVKPSGLSWIGKARCPLGWAANYPQSAGKGGVEDYILRRTRSGSCSCSHSGPIGQLSPLLVRPPVPLLFPKSSFAQPVQKYINPEMQCWCQNWPKCKRQRKQKNRYLVNPVLPFLPVLWFCICICICIFINLVTVVQYFSSSPLGGEHLLVTLVNWTPLLWSPSSPIVANTFFYIMYLL